MTIAANEDEQAALVYRNYVATLHAYQAVDFDDLIRLPAELFAKNEQVRDRWQNKLRYLLIDESDTNACQYELLKLLAGARRSRRWATTRRSTAGAARRSRTSRSSANFEAAPRQARAELPVDGAHPDRREQRDREQPEAVREEAVVRARDGRFDHRHAVQRRGA